MTRREKAVRALYEGSLAEPGDQNPYAGRSLVLAKLWMRGYLRMLRLRVESSLAMQRYRKAAASGKEPPEVTVRGDAGV